MSQNLSSADSISEALEEKLSALNENETLSAPETSSKSKKRIFTRDIKITVYKLQEVGFNATLFDKL